MIRTAFFVKACFSVPKTPFLRPPAAAKCWWYIDLYGKGGARAPAGGGGGGGGAGGGGSTINIVPPPPPPGFRRELYTVRANSPFRGFAHKSGVACPLPGGPLFPQYKDFFHPDKTILPFRVRVFPLRIKTLFHGIGTVSRHKGRLGAALAGALRARLKPGALCRGLASRIVDLKKAPELKPCPDGRSNVI